MDIIKTVTCLFLALHCVYALPPATSHQSMVSGEGWRYSYGIVHGPHGYATGESYPHGYGGFGTYASGYGHGDYGISGHHLSPQHPVVLAHPGLESHPVLSSYLEHHELPSLVTGHHEVPLVQHPEVVIHQETPLVHHETPFLHHETPFVHHETPLVHHESPVVHHETPVLSHEILAQYPAPAHHEIIPSPPIIVGKPESHYDNDYSSLFDGFKKYYYGAPSSQDYGVSFDGAHSFSAPSQSYGNAYSYEHAPASFSFNYHH